MKRKILLLFAIIILFSTGVQAQEDEIVYITEKAEVLEIVESLELEDSTFDSQLQTIRIRILSGARKGQELLVENTISDNAAYNIVVDRGDLVMITGEKQEGSDQEEFYISDYYRLDGLKILGLIFLVLLLLIGGRSGIRALVSLALTIFAIIYVLLPGMLAGINPILLSSLVSIAITLVTIVIITGFTGKSLAAIVGTSLGVLIAGLISILIGLKSRLTGLTADDATMLMYIPQGVEFNFQQLLFAGIILGALGAVMDVGMSIASAIEEIHQNKQDLSARDLFLAGMNVGRDIMGTMVNTLILAYTGSAIPMLLLFMAYDGRFLEVLNLDMIASEVVRSVSGSIGLILTIPITSALASFIIKRKKIDK